MNSRLLKEFPQDFFVKIEQNEHLLGRIVLNQIDGLYAVEVDIVFSDSKKIFYSIGSYYRLNDPNEALETGVQNLRQAISELGNRS